MIFCGSSVESEPETKAVTTFIRGHLASIKGYITIHAYSQKLLFPYGYTAEEAPTHDKLVCRKREVFINLQQK